MPIFPFKPQPTPIQHRIQLPALPNAAVGQPYHAPFAAPDILDVALPAHCGLAWENGCVRGTPVQAGDITLTVRIRHTGGTETLHHPLHINPDPRSLWQNRPSDPNAPFATPDRMSEHHPTAHGQLIAARIRGRSHAHSGAYCDDAYRIAHHPQSQAHLLAIADGAGSAPYARLGAELAVHTALHTLLRALDHPDTRHHLTHPDAAHARTALPPLIGHTLRQTLQAHDHAIAQHPQIPDRKALSCTLLLALTLPYTQGWRTITHQIGDGAIAAYHPHNWHLLGHADHGAYAGETQFLTPDMHSPEALAARTQLHHSTQAPRLLLMSDGLSDPKFPQNTDLHNPEHWQQLWHDLRTPLAQTKPDSALLDWLDFWSPGHHDDRALALFIPKDTP